MQKGKGCEQLKKDENIFPFNVIKNTEKTRTGVNSLTAFLIHFQQFFLTQRIHHRHVPQHSASLNSQAN